MRHALLLPAVLLACVTGQAAVISKKSTAAAGDLPVTTASAEARALYQRALDLQDNLRPAETMDALQKALIADPGFATARALLATYLQPPENQKMMTLAQSEAEGLPEAERAVIEGYAAGLAGDDAKGREWRKRAVELAPLDARAHLALGQEAMGDRAWERAVAELTRATELGPRVAGAWNQLGYTYALQQRYPEAIQAFHKYAEVAPAEPNSHDSLAEALLNAGQLDEAEKEFREAVRIEPHFAQAWMAVADIRGLKGDWQGCNEAIAREIEADLRPADQLTARVALGTALMAQGRYDDAEKAFAQAMTEGAAQGMAFRFAAGVLRSRNFGYDGNGKAALAAGLASVKELESAGLPDAVRDGFLRGALNGVIRGQALSGDAAGAERTLKRIEELSAPFARQAFAASNLANARGLAKAARGDHMGAATAMMACITPDIPCQLDYLRSLVKLGDAEGAAHVRSLLEKTPLRTLDYVYVMARLRGGAAQSESGPARSVH